MSLLQSMQLMMSIKAAIAGITNVGSKATYAMLNPTTAGVHFAMFNLPTGSAVGDTATITAEAAGYAGFTWGAIAGATVALSNVLVAYQLTVQIYKLTQADVAAGTLSVPYTITSSGSWSIAMTGGVDVDRGVGSMDVVGTYTSGSASGFTNCTLPGVTTALDGDVVRYAFFTDSVSTGTTITQPVGFTSGDPPFSVYSGSSYTGYTKQSVAGASGSVVVGYLLQYQNFNWAGVLVALKPYVPAVFALTGTFGAGTVGVPWTGVLTFTGDYTGPVTMDVAAGTKPAWIGTPVVDEIAKTATYTGTPTTATSISFTPRATPAVGTAATAPQTFAVAAASAAVDYFDPARLGSYITLSNANKTMTGGVAAWRTAYGVTGHSTGLWYVEFYVESGPVRWMTGLGNASASTNNYPGSTSNGWCVLSSNGNKYSAGSKGACVPAYDVGDVVRCWWNATTGSIWFGVNGAITGDPVAGTGAAFTGITETLFPGFAVEVPGASGTLRVKNSEFSYAVTGSYQSWSGS